MPKTKEKTPTKTPTKKVAPPAFDLNAFRTALRRKPMECRITKPEGAEVTEYVKAPRRKLHMTSMKSTYSPKVPQPKEGTAH